MTVVRGPPSASQRHLDSVLDAVLQRRYHPHVTARQHVNVPQVIYHSMTTRPRSTHMINGTTGESFTNEKILKQAVPLARALLSRGLSGTRIMLVMRNHEQAAWLYYGAMFAGVAPFLLDPQSTVHELQHFISLVEPRLVFCDAGRREDVLRAGELARSRGSSAPAPDHVVEHDRAHELASGHSDDLDTFIPTGVSLDSTLALLPTSGSSGPAKAAVLTHRGLMAHLPALWQYHSRFPRPTERAMFLSTAQWMTYTNLMTSAPVYDVTILTSPKKTPDHAIHMMERYRPTWLLLVPGTAKIISVPVRADQLTSLETVLLTGAPPAPDTMALLQEKLPASAHLCNSYGMTEAQGFVCIPERGSPLMSPGRVFNFIQYKLVDDDNKEVKDAHENGELYLKGACIIESYLHDEPSYLACVSGDGWWKTGDVFRRDESERMYFVQRKKLWFKYLNYHISPEELEELMSSVPGVEECVSWGTEEGAAAAVVVRAGHQVTRDQLHAAVAVLHEYKRLNGGIAFVDALPRTHSGKLNRRECNKLVEDLVRGGQCHK